MGTRVVVVLLLLGLGGFVWLTNDKANNPAPPPKVNQTAGYFDPDAEGVEPDSPPEFNVDTVLVYEGEKGILNFTISEAHGWYADHLYVRFRYFETDEDGEDLQVGGEIRYLCHHYLPFKETLQEYTTLLNIEFPDLDDWGTSKNWRADIVDYGKVLAPLP